MKNRTILAVSAAAVCLALAAGLAGCKANSSAGGLKTKTRYVLAADVNKKEELQSFMEFYSNGEGRYYVVIADENTLSEDVIEYCIKFDYTYADTSMESVACFYDSVDVTRGEYELPPEICEWSGYFNVSKNIVYSPANDVMFVCESFIGDIPNFMVKPNAD